MVEIIKSETDTARRPFAVFDIDGTLIRWQLYHAIADGLAKAGHFKPEVYQNIREARMQWKKRVGSHSFKTYEAELVRAYDHLITSLKVEDFNQVAQKVFEEYKDQVYTYTRDLLKQLKSQGYMLIAISGSQSDIVRLVADHYGFDHCEGSVYTQKDGMFTGEKFFAAKDKARLLAEIIKKHGLSIEGSVAVGDSQGDIPMLQMVENPIAFNPEQELFTIAQKQGWKIVIERKNMVYELERGDGPYILAKTNV